MNALRRFLIAVKGYRAPVQREGDEEGPFEGSGIGRGLYERDANFIINEARLRESADFTAEPKNKPLKLNVITTSNMGGREAEGPTIRSLTEPEPRPEPSSPSLREIWRRLRKEVNKNERSSKKKKR